MRSPASVRSNHCGLTGGCSFLKCNRGRDTTSGCRPVH
uniref:Uncharacterized protein n=2 Tax=unclassified Caudoviricetes TaxID=2788787 RepID=A0A8S5PUP2_9CAUD|nr:MAG TPA: hypothetical protein [Siphoviridae sp. ctPxx43]DAE10257.1 MAG TPA: hypothetical protein [Siphoviridae sp. ct0yh16]